MNDSFERKHFAAETLIEIVRKGWRVVWLPRVTLCPYHAIVLGVFVTITAVEGYQTSEGMYLVQADPVSGLHVNPVRLGDIKGLLTSTRGCDLVLAHNCETGNSSARENLCS